MNWLHSSGRNTQTFHEQINFVIFVETVLFARWNMLNEKHNRSRGRPILNQSKRKRDHTQIHLQVQVMKEKKIVSQSMTNIHRWVLVLSHSLSLSHQSTKFIFYELIDVSWSEREFDSSISKVILSFYTIWNKKKIRFDLSRLWPRIA